MTLKEFIEQNVRCHIINQLPTGRMYRHPSVAKLCEEETKKSESFFYPHFENGTCINKPEIKYILKKEWDEEGMKQFMEMNYIPIDSSGDVDTSDCGFCKTHKKGDALYESHDWDVYENIQYCPLCGNELKET